MSTTKITTVMQEICRLLHRFAPLENDRDNRFLTGEASIHPLI